MAGFAIRQRRREFLRASLLGSGALLVGLDKLCGFAAAQKDDRDPFFGGQQLGVLEFTRESRAPLDTIIGSGLDARLFSDLSTLTPEQPVTPIEKFYVRTTASDLLDTTKPWTIDVSGLVEAPLSLRFDEINASSKPMGLHLMECSGNARATRFALLSVADWSGLPLYDLLAARVKGKTDRVMVSGFDEYLEESANSIPGADWIFTLEQLRSAKAFLATQMNGHALRKDHGAPVRLVVPGWYGCTCIKWVKAIRFVGKDAQATSQMQEFAVRTDQRGVPQLASEYKPASIDQAAMPVRVEKWLVSGKIKYRVVGILWGGSRPVKVLEIRFNPEEDYVPVDKFSQTENDPWTFWWHTWTPKAPGTYSIRLRVTDPVVETKRLDSGHYVRSVEVTEV
ncbi:MAG TPA: molybdopterin-dependent oxidoreductase [Candidatus Dormibacteraeota bacterium]|nr:molybdopterin-dependent oxidoreductase [Candidatus Dormibacteraeota bacterium]